MIENIVVKDLAGATFASSKFLDDELKGILKSMFEIRHNFNSSNFEEHFDGIRSMLSLGSLENHQMRDAMLEAIVYIIGYAEGEV